MTDDEAQSWAEQWIEEWNRRDVEAMLAHFADDVEFRSPVAAAVTGDPVVRGRDALRDYWNTALTRVPDLHFDLVDVLVGVDCIAIHYRNQTGQAVTEMAIFDADGKVAQGWGLYGA